MDIKIKIPESNEALTEFVQFYDQVYDYREARWPAPLELQLPILTGDSPFAHGHEIRPFLAYHGSSIIARAAAVMDEHYQRHWNEHLGHIIMFEAMPDSRAATKLLMNAACEWLKERGAGAARAGFGLLDFPFVIDDYESLPPELARQNPDYYHRLLKDAGFESEKGWVDYKIELRRSRSNIGITRSRPGAARDTKLCRSKTFLTRAALATSPPLGGTPSSRIGALHL